MAEASGSPAPAAPSNGTSAPTTPAPGTTTPTPTPKNGEGAVASTAPVNPWAEFKGETEITYKGQKQKVQVKSPEDIARLAQRAKLSDESAKRAAEAERRLNEILEAASKDKLAYLKAAGIDPEAFVLEQAQEMLKRQEMTAEQRAVAEAKAELARAKQEAAALKANWERQQQEQMQAQAWQEEAPHWEESLKKRNRIGDKAYLELAAKVGSFLASHGIEATPEQICAETDEQWNASVEKQIDSTPADNLMQRIASKVDPAAALQALAPRLTPDLLWSVLQSDDARRQVMALGLAWHKGLKTQATTATKPPAPQRTRAQDGKYLSESEWRAKREGK